MHFPLASIALSYDWVAYSDIARLMPLFAEMPLHVVLCQELEVLDIRGPASWEAQRSKGDIERIGTAIRADYEEYGIMKKAVSSVKILFFHASPLFG
jgi:hypothetical protein